jgi:hypothetical protein
VDKFNDPVTYGATLGIDEQPVLVLINQVQYLYLPLISR